ncbi:hypothetical protein LCGC14_0581490 [marine sediment metagenome]|uniref:Uncharacterized protein n=1 Tax=marine sediment metagenome TaxID=412755 RepID=A0A0F9RGA6_9ZZZZ|nr:hypothetical protein [Methylophaga sp.]
MLIAEGIVGKVVSFIVNKSIDSLVSIPFDKHRKACRALTKLYYSVQALDDVTESFIQTLNHFKHSGDASAVIHALNSHSHEVELTTNSFIDLGNELYGGLEIIDPVLAECCHSLYRGKGDFLSFLSNSIEWDRSPESSRVLLKRPLGKMQAVDMDSMYERTKLALASGEKHYWPSSAFDDFSSDFEEISIGWEDNKAAKEFESMIIQQNQLLKEAKEGLRKLLKENFSIEEILFQSDAHPYR